MLRPERMSRVSVTGAKRVMDDVVEAVHDLHLLHLTEYDGSWEGFEPGDPVGGADETSETLVTVRALESILDVDEDDAGPTRLIDDETLDEELEEIRQEVNELDDRRTELEEELKIVEERIDTFQPFAALDLDLDLLSGYESLAVAVGEGDGKAVERKLDEADAVAAHEVFTEGDAVAAFVYPAEADPEAFSIDDLLVGVPFTAYEVPEADGDPDAYLSELHHRQQQLEGKLSTVEDELEDVRLDVGGFLLAVEEKLTIEVQKREAPLSFATTDSAFVAEGWIPTGEFAELEAALTDAVGDHVEVEEVERATYDGKRELPDGEVVPGPGHHGEHEGDEGTGAGESGPAPAAAADAASPAEGDGDGEQETVADGGVVTMRDDSPPVTQDNPDLVRPFELMTKAVGRPNYTELDPTFVLFLTFPVMFGFMIGDVGYGIIYTAIGYYLIANYESETFRNFGIVAAWAGVMTIVFGVLYGEIFGLHLVSTHLWEPLTGGSAPIHKGLQPHYTYWAQAWFVVTALFGVAHLNLAYVFEFAEEYSLHGIKDAVLETGSWLLALNGLWIFVFSRLFEGNKPDLLFQVFGQGDGAAFALGFTGLPAWTGWVGIAMVGVGALLLVLGPAHEIIEIHQVLAHALSYLRIAAVLLAKAGMAFAVNLLVFGAVDHDGHYEFFLTHGPGEEAMFDGLFHMGPAAVLLGIFVLVVGHLVVLLLGVTSAGIQSIRLEYFEFFSKFYEGGGTTYSPFGKEREYTARE